MVLGGYFRDYDFPDEFPSENPNHCILINPVWLSFLTGAVWEKWRREIWKNEIEDHEEVEQLIHDLLDVLTVNQPQAKSLLDIGDIYQTMAANVDNDTRLICDGRTLQRVDYPELYATVDDSWIIDADNFQLPDFIDRTARGGYTTIGGGDGLLTGQSGGLDQVTIAVENLPAIVNAGVPVPESTTIPVGGDERQQVVKSVRSYGANAIGANEPLTVRNRFTSIVFVVIAKL